MLFIGSFAGVFFYIAGLEVSPQKVKYVETSSEGITNVVLEGLIVHEDPLEPIDVP